MSFSSDFSSCLSPLPAPTQVLDSALELADWLEQLHGAWEASGGEVEMTMEGLAAVGGAAVFGEAALEVVGPIAQYTVLAYITACTLCAAGAAAAAGGQAVKDYWNAVTATSGSFVSSQLTAAANDKNLPQPDSSSSDSALA